MRKKGNELLKRKYTYAGTKRKVDKVDKAIYNWFINNRSQVPIDAFIIQKNAIEFAKALQNIRLLVD